MTLGESISTCFKKYFVIQGRASKSEFWWFQLIWVVSYLSILIFKNEAVVFFCIGIIIIIAIPLFTVGIRRLHDTGKSGLHFLWGCIPFIGGLIFIILMLADGTKGKNQYGEDPLKKRKRSKKK
tara:strand:- start:82 stop:453 length:372 start_codon:yes stop_codon:yes gene_type:complete